MDRNKHYIRLDSNSSIIHGFSDAFEQALEGDICIDEYGRRHFEMNGQINPSLHMNGIYLYKLIDGEIIEKSPEELEAEKAAMPPAPETPEQKIARLEQLVADLASLQLGV